jgi:hypothetical protein
MHITWLLFISYGHHFNNMALFRMKCTSNALALCGITMICLTQGRSSQRYANISQTGSVQNECFLLQLCTQSCWTSSELSHTRLSEYRVFCLVYVEYVQYFVAGWQHVLQWLHITEMSYLSVRFIRLAISFATFLFTVLYDNSVVRSAISLKLADILLISVFPLMVVETRMAPKVSVVFQTKDSRPCG